MSKPPFDSNEEEDLTILTEVIRALFKLPEDRREKILRTVNAWHSPKPTMTKNEKET